MLRSAPTLGIPSVTDPVEVDLAYQAAQAVVRVHQRLASWLKVGLTLAEIDQFIAKELAAEGCTSAFKGYRIPKMPPFPSCACLGVNDCVVHGTAGHYLKPLKPGDLLKVDIGVFRKGWVGDAGWTYAVKERSPLAKQLMDCGKESLRRGVQMLRPGNIWLNWAETVQQYVEGECGFQLVEGLGGHGYGKKLHAPPYVSNVVPYDLRQWPEAKSPIMAGTLVAVEPMINAGSGETRHVKGWPVFSADGSLSVHYEHDVLVTAAGPRVLSEGMDGLPDVVG